MQLSNSVEDWLRIAAVTVAGLVVALGPAEQRPLSISLFAIVVALLSLSLAMRRRDAEFLRLLGYKPPIPVRGEEAIYRDAIQLLDRMGHVEHLRLYAPGAFAKRDSVGRHPTKEQLLRDLGKALADGRVGRLTYVFGLPKQRDYLNTVLQLLENSIVQPSSKRTRSEAIPVSLRFLREPASETSAACLAFGVYDDKALFLCCATEPGVPVPSRQWRWDDQELATAFRNAFDAHVLDTTEVLWDERKEVSFEQGKALALRLLCDLRTEESRNQNEPHGSVTVSRP